MENAILVEGIRKRFGDVTALDGLDLAVRPGTVLGLLGPNGAGKTTAVRIMATLMDPDEGRVSVAGLDAVRDAHRVRQLIGLTGQYAAVDETLTGSENLLLIGRLLGMSRADARQRAAELLGDFDLTDAAGRPAKNYSGGMRRRLDLAASLVGRPQVLFLDEPTTGLDPRARLDLWELVKGLVADGVTVLLTTQYLEEADALAGDIVVVDGGRAIASGTPSELKARTGSQRLEVQPAAAEDLGTVRATVAAVTGVDPDVDDLLVSAPVKDPGAMSAVVRRLDDAGVAVGELALRSASLDEVFLSLTGRPAAERAATVETDETEEVAA